MWIEGRSSGLAPGRHWRLMLHKEIREEDRVHRMERNVAGFLDALVSHDNASDAFGLIHGPNVGLVEKAMEDPVCFLKCNVLLRGWLLVCFAGPSLVGSQEILELCPCN
jgi:hypothetical protein